MAYRSQHSACREWPSGIRSAQSSRRAAGTHILLVCALSRFPLYALHDTILMQLAEPCMSSCSSFGLTLISTLQRFDLILLDIVMPVMDGVELLTILQSEQYLRHIPVVSDQE